MTTLLEPGAGEGTVLPLARHAPARTSAPVRRQMGGVTRNDRLTVLGALASAVCTSALLFGRVATFSGRFGFVVVTYVVFLATYALLVWLSDDRPAVIDKLMTVVLYSAAAVMASGLAP